MTNEQRILNIEIELARVKADLAKEAPTLERQEIEEDDIYDAVRKFRDEKAKDWEILEYITTEKHNNPGVKIPTKDMEHSWRYHYDCANNNGWVAIHAVRRLSDNTVWTVGDKVLSGTYHVPQSIIRFFTFSDKLIVETNVFILDIGRLRQLARPLFTTADGVQIFQGDKFWYWHDSGWLKEIDTGFHEWWSWKDRPYSTREAAEEAYNTWAWNEPVLSCEEAVRLLNACLTGDQLARLKLFVKDKIAKR